MTYCGINRNGILPYLYLAGLVLLWAFAAPFAYAAPYNYTDAPGGGVAIPDSSCGTASVVSRTINVSDSFFIDDLNLGFIASHPYRQPVEVTLTSPSSTSVVAIINGDTTQNYNVELDSASGSSLIDGLNHNTGSTPYQYTRAPSNSLDAFNGEQANGNWTLEVCDSDGFNDNGTYLQGELIFQGTAGSGPGFPSGVTSPATGTYVNSYAAVSSISGTVVSVDTTTGFTAGGRGLIVQMQGATVNRADSASHGDVTAYGTAGRFEYVDIQSVSAGTITLASAPSITFDTSGAVQIVSVPIYDNQTLSGTISAPIWDGSKGGVVAIDDTGTMTLSGDIDVSGLGFQGGALAITTGYDSCASDQTNYTGTVQDGTGNKGGGITADSALHAARRGHNANGGGGGNITDAGGGGGGNVGVGGLGGRELDLCDGASGPNYGGLGGQALDYTTSNRMFMGGGAGSGSEVGQAATGGDRSGGGLVFLRAESVTNSGGRILTIGLTALQDDFNGADGGAAGGSVAISVHSGISGLPTVSVAGGDGGDEANGTYAHGTGGGGGGGAIRLNGAVCSDLSYQVDGGEAGMSTLGAGVGDPNWGATDGGPGDCAGGFSAIPLIPLSTLDYSDAPTSGTSYGDATHTIVSGIQLGASVDADAGSLASTNADGDDNNGTDDEDGVSSFPTLTEGDTGYTIPLGNITAQGDGTLHAWIDIDGDGSFSADEYASAAVTAGAVQSDLVWSFSDLMSAGTTFARFRITSDGSINSGTPIAAANDGEVEDYELTVSSAPVIVNCGTDTDSGYATGGTGTFTEEIFWLDWTCGATTQFDPGNQYTKSWDAGNGIIVSATLNNITASIEPYNTGVWGGDVLDDMYSGVNPIGLVNVTDGQDPTFDISFSATLDGVSIPADIVVADAESSDTSNEAWEFTSDGTSWQPIETNGFLDAQFTNGAQTLHFSDAGNNGNGTILALTEGVSTINVVMTAGGKQASAFGIFVNFDYGDADGISTNGHFIGVSASGGSQPTTLTPGSSLTLATIGYSTDYYIGSVSPDRESAHQGSPNADGDDSAGTDDEEGVTIPALTQGVSASISVNVTQSTANSGYLQAWIDWDGNGSFADAGEQIATDLQSGSSPTGTINIPVTVPGTATTSQTYARFRWSTTSGLNMTDRVLNGEVEDYALTINAGATPVCPAGYTLTSSTGYADAVIVAANNSTFALGAPETPGTTATNSNSARTTQTLPTLTLDMTDILPENGILALTIAKNNAAADYSIEMSSDNSTYTPIATYNTGTEDDLQIFNVTVPSGGARYVRFVRTAGSLWVGGVEYGQICASNAVLNATKTVSVWDPGAAGLYALPGNDVIYTISATNSGDGPADTDSIVMIDPIPADVEFYNGDIDDGGPETDPVSFTQTGAGLTFTYATDVAYSNAATNPADFASCTYSPAAGYDPNVTYICVNPKGSMAAGDPDPTFAISFRVRIK